ncbi:hypothetical protein [Amantichitinum ursilacus]|uniref:Uncharacterized protein n=1 Tax=Amantichitinum ursilacus TaxID=857265 RepID=A0A0N0GPU7_9NEIS|nr:hypothetical protein [Amantichitinum ursilacus]KPC54035.1 hypothetical protein WG78_05280 [Amantichitinum ursilacus]
MVDCLEIEPALSLPRRALLAPVISPAALRLEHRCWLRLKTAAGVSVAALSRASAVATALGYPTGLLADGSLAVLDIELEAALLFCQRLPELIGCYEVPTRQGCVGLTR